ncbi:hypothetical protein PS1_032135 [Malus domestica]
MQTPRGKLRTLRARGVRVRINRPTGEALEVEDFERRTSWNSGTDWEGEPDESERCPAKNPSIKSLKFPYSAIFCEFLGLKDIKFSWVLWLLLSSAKSRSGFAAEKLTGIYMPQNKTKKKLERIIILILHIF